MKANRDGGGDEGGREGGRWMGGSVGGVWGGGGTYPSEIALLEVSPLEGTVRHVRVSEVTAHALHEAQRGVREVGSGEVCVGYRCVIQHSVPSVKLARIHTSPPPTLFSSSTTHLRLMSAQQALLIEAPPSNTFRRFALPNCEKSRFARVRSIP